MKKLAFIVGHPTQFEGPMYQYFNKLDENFIHVYFYSGIKKTFIDNELSGTARQSWGIDILSNYLYSDIKIFKLKTVLEIIKNNKYIIVNGYINVYSITVLIIGRLFKKKVGLRLDTVPWNNLKLSKKIYKYILLRILNLFVDSFWAVGTKTKEYLISNGISTNKINYLSYVVDNDWFSKNSDLSIEEKQNFRLKYNINPKNKVILCVSKLVEREMPINVIDAIIKLNDPSITLIIAGDGNKRQFLENYVDMHSMKTKIKFIGYTNYQTLPLLYAIADLFIHPSKNEPWGVSIQEAMSCGLPVISSNFVGAGFDLIKEGVNGFIYKHNDIEDLVQKIQAALKFDIDNVKSINSTLLEDWNYLATFNRINQHIANL